MSVGGIDAQLKRVYNDFHRRHPDVGKGTKLERKIAKYYSEFSDLEMAYLIVVKYRGVVKLGRK